LECDCRKPKPGMLLRSARELGIDLAQSWMVGDRWRDIDCGHAAGLPDNFYRSRLRGGTSAKTTLFGWQFG